MQTQTQPKTCSTCIQNHTCKTQQENFPIFGCSNHQPQTVNPKLQRKWNNLQYWLNHPEHPLAKTMMNIAVYDIDAFFAAEAIKQVKTLAHKIERLKIKHPEQAQQLRRQYLTNYYSLPTHEATTLWNQDGYVRAALEA
jgi:hypothetical protein